MSVTGSHMALGAGLMLGAASTLSIGPNNLMLMREGLKQGHAGTLATTVWASYGILLATAYSAADAIDTVPPLVQALLSWAGLAALAFFAVQSLWAARPAAESAPRHAAHEARSTCIRRALLVIWCNPLTYLELLIVPSAICASFSSAPSRLLFVATVLTMAGLCAFGYAHGGRLLASLLRHRHVVRAFDAVAGLLLASAAVAIGVRLIAATS